MSMRYRRRKRKPSQMSREVDQDFKASEIVKKVASIKQDIDESARPRGSISMTGNRYNSSGLLPSQTHNRSWGIINEPMVREPNFRGAANKAGWLTMDPFASPEMSAREKDTQRIAPGKVTLTTGKSTGRSAIGSKKSVSLRATKAEKIYEASDERPKKPRKWSWFSRAR